MLIAAVSFSLLTSAVSTSQAEVRATVSHNFRAAYDILVRPPGSRTSVERRRHLVQANYLSGIFGGISMAQWRQVEQVPGVAVAAPIAMVGYALPFTSVPVDLAGVLDRSPRQLFRIQVVWHADNGLSRLVDAPSFVYVARNSRPTSLDAIGQQFYAGLPPARGPFDPNGRTFLTTWPVNSTGKVPARQWRFQTLGSSLAALPVGRPGSAVSWAFPFLVAAIDPVQEARLDGVDHAIVHGRYLTEKDKASLGGPFSVSHHEVPALAAVRPFSNDQLSVRVQRVTGGSAAQLPRLLRSPDPLQALGRQRAVTVARLHVSSRTAYARLLGQVMEINNYWSSGPISYRASAGGAVRPVPVTNGPGVWRDRANADGYAFAPLDNHDTNFRRLTEHLGSNLITGGALQLADMKIVGQLDPSRLRGFNPLTAVPLATYVPPGAAGADPRSRRLLGGHDLAPDENIAGYLQPPPLLLTTLKALPALTNPDHYAGTQPGTPISVIRVRVGGLHGSVREQVTRIGQVAAQIHRVTGLQVDVTAGSSPTSVTVALPAGRYGRPQLNLSEPWVKKAAAVIVLTAVDDKSLILFVLVLVVCGLFIANSTYASVRTRRAEVATLRCLGWSAGEVFRAILGELGLIGLVAGILGTGLAIALARLLSLALPTSHALLVVPAALALVLLAGLGPAWRASRAVPMDALRPAARPPRGAARPVRSIPALAVSNLRRLPGRTVLGVAGLVLAVAALTVLLAITVAFQGAVTGSLLGDVIAVQVRAVDYVSAALATVLGAAGVADALVLNQRERSHELATLRATGWSEPELVRLTLIEGLLMALAGSVLGALLGLGLASLIAGTPTTGIILAAAGAAAGGVGIVAASLIAPAWLASRVTPAHALAEEA